MIRKSKYDFKNTCNNAKNPWGFMNKIIRGRFSPMSVPTLQKDDGTFISSDEETAQYLLEKWFPDDCTSDNNEEQSRLRQLVDHYLSKDITDSVPEISLDELDIINLMKPFKSSPNDIPPIVFQKFSINSKSIIRKLFNICLLSSYFPTNWKIASPGIALLKTLLKQNKHLLHKRKSCRPISLLSVLGKWFGKVILQRLLWHQSTSNWISRMQFGFQPGKSCVDAVLNILEKTESAFKANKYVLVIYLDIAGAFDGA